MQIKYIEINDIEKQKALIEPLCALYKDERLLLLNLLQNNREVEITLKVEDLIIYNAHDLIKRIVPFYKAVQEISEKLHLIASYPKEENIVFDSKDILDLVTSDEDYEYDIVLILYNQSKPIDFDSMKYEKVNIEGLFNHNKSLLDKIKEFFKK